MKASRETDLTGRVAMHGFVCLSNLKVLYNRPLVDRKHDKLFTTIIITGKYHVNRITSVCHSVLRDCDAIAYTNSTAVPSTALSRDTRQTEEHRLQFVLGKKTDYFGSYCFNPRPSRYFR